MTAKFRHSLALLAVLSTSAYADILSDVAEKFGQMAHSSGQCPKVADGFYNADTTTSPFFIEVYNNRETNLMEMNLNGIEQVPINGKDTPQNNGFKITGLCADNAIRIVGQDAGGGLIYVLVKPANDGGLQLERREPARPAMHYSAAGPLRTPTDQIRKWFTPDSSKKSGTGLPR